MAGTVAGRLAVGGDLEVNDKVGVTEDVAQQIRESSSSEHGDGSQDEERPEAQLEPGTAGWTAHTQWLRRVRMSM